MKIAFIEVAEKININWCPTLIYALLKKDLEERNHNCKILRIDKDDLSNKIICGEFKKFLSDEKFDLVGIQSRVVAYVKKIINETCPNSKIVIGGSNSIASINEPFDYLLHGSGRKSFLMLVEYMEGKRDISSIHNIFYKEKEIICHSGRIKEMKIDEELLPFHPDFKRINFGEMKTGEMNFANIVSSLGCPYVKKISDNCFYKDLDISEDLPKTNPTAHKILKNIYSRAKTGCSFCLICLDRKYTSFANKNLIPNILQQYKYIIENYPSVNRIQINDENSFRYLYEFFQAVKKLRPVEIMIAGRSDFFLRYVLDIEKTLKIIKGTNFVLNVACIGFENFSQKELDILNKGTTVQDNIQTLEWLNKLSEKYPKNFEFRKDKDHGTILFNPWTTIENLNDNVKWYRKFDIHHLINPSTPLATRLGVHSLSSIYYKAKADGLLLSSRNLYDYGLINWKFIDPMVNDIFQQMIKYANSIEYLKGQNLFMEKQLDYLEKLLKIPKTQIDTTEKTELNSSKDYSIATNDVADIIQKHMKPTSKLLDVGCGFFTLMYPQYTHLIETNNITVYGVDADKLTIDSLKKLIPKQYRKNFVLINSLIESIDFKNEFEVILLVNTFRHLENLSESLDKIVKSMKDDSILVIQDCQQEKSDYIEESNFVQEDLEEVFTVPIDILKKLKTQQFSEVNTVYRNSSLLQTSKKLISKGLEIVFSYGPCKRGNHINKYWIVAKKPTTGKQ